MPIPSLPPAELSRALDDFTAFLKIESVSGDGPQNGAYDACGDWLLKSMKEMGIEAQILPESREHKPVVVGTIKGSEVR
jgi:acetylornithine deacetylase/succinyl-diaminopimelate desuccinylase-like protein